MKAKKFLSIIFIVIILINSIYPITKAESCNLGEDVSLTGYGSVECHVRNSERGGYAIATDLVGYYEGNIFYPAYCLNRGNKGADNHYTQTVNASEILSNKEMYNKIWRVIVAGYPNHTAEELGVDNDSYAYQATKMAIYHVVGEYTSNSSEKTDINNYYGVDDIGNRTVALMKRLVDEADNGTNTYKNPISSISEVGNISLKDMYYVQKYKVTSNVGIKSYIPSIEGFPVGTEITNTEGVIKTEFIGGENFEVRIPKDAIETEDVTGKVSATVNTKSYVMFFGKTYDQALQNYAITTNPITAVDTGTINFNSKGNTASIKIIKVDKETNEPISGTTYELMDNNGNVIGQATTDSEGILTFNELYQNTYTLKEIKSNDNYVISSETIDIMAEYNKVIEKIVTNEHKKGNLKIQKVDKDNHKIALGNVEFDLYSEEQGKIIGTYKTDVNGEILIENLRTGKYKIIEKNTNKWYDMAEDTEINIEWNNTTVVTIENELKKGRIKIVKLDKDDNEIKIPNVKFEVIDVAGRVLETIITNEQGEASTQAYPIRDYEKLILKEIEAHEGYTLDETPIEVILKDGAITEIELENEVKKGQIKVVKIDKDNNDIKLEGVKFEVYDEDDKLVQTLTTDKNGEATTDKLRISKSYYIKEVETKENYKLNEEIININLEESKIKELIIENEKKKGQIQVTKIDSENKEIYIPNVTFEIYNSKGEIVDKVVTNQEGKALTKELPIDETYTIKETSAPKEYVLNEIIQTVILEDGRTTELIFENTKKYGKIKINKLSNKYSKILDLPENSPIPNTKFLILNKKGENMGIYTTDETGAVTTENLPYGEYTIYEYETPEHFFKDSKPQTLKITENNQILEVTFTNTPREPELPKTGF